MFNQNYEQIESMLLNLCLVGLFLLMGMAVHDVMKKNDVPMVGRVVAYGVLGLGAAGFLIKGIIQIFWHAQGISG